MTRIAATTAEDFKFQLGDTGPIRTQKLELLRQDIIDTAKRANNTAPSYILADGLQALDVTLFPESLPPMLIGREVPVSADSAGFEYDQNILLGTRNWLPVGTGRTFEASFRARLFSDGSEAGNLSSGFMFYSSGGLYLGSLGEVIADASWVVADGALDAEATTTSAAILAAFPTAAYVRGFVLPESNGGTYVINRPSIADVTVSADASAALADAEAAAAAALASAIGAAASNTTAAGHATSASASASTATGQASAATASAVAAQSYADDADTFATAASVSASAASTSATAAGSSASAANTSSISAATQATNASGSASAAATSATSASSSSTAAGNSATAANVSKLAAEAADASATAQASISTAQAVIATAQAAAASSSAILSASITPNARNKDPNMTVWTDATTLTNWLGYSGTANRVAGFQATYSNQMANGAGVLGGVYQNIAFSPGWWVEEMEVTLNSGTLRGVGIHTHSYTGVLGAGSATGDNSLTDFWSRHGDGVVGQTYKIGVIRQWTTACLSAKHYSMTHWTGFVSSGGDTSAANDVTVRYCGIRPATEMEIRDKTALVPLEATVATQATAIVDAATKLAEARLRISVAASGGDPAILELYSATGATSFLRLAAEQILFGDNTTFDDATDTLETIIAGTQVNCIAWGLPFGTSSDLLQWVGPTGIALASRTKANAYFYIATTAPRIGGTELVATPPAGTLSVAANITGVVCDVPTSGTTENTEYSASHTFALGGTIRIRSRGYTRTTTTNAAFVRVRVKVINNGTTTVLFNRLQPLIDSGTDDDLDGVTVVTNPITLAGASTIVITSERSGATGQSGGIFTDFELERIAP